MEAKDFKAGDCVLISGDPRVWSIDTINSDGFHATTITEPKRCIIHVFGDQKVVRALREEIEVGHRIDKVVPFYANPRFAYTVLSGAQVGAVLTVAQQIDDMGDDSNLQHHLSPFCEVRDV